MITLFGIKNCDTVRKARQWLDENAIAYHFHDFKSDGLTSAQLHYFLAHCAWESLLNKRGTTWKTLNSTQVVEVDAQSMVALCLEHPTLIKRPILDMGGKIVIGFNPIHYQAALSPQLLPTIKS